MKMTIGAMLTNKSPHPVSDVNDGQRGWLKSQGKQPRLANCSFSCFFCVDNDISHSSKHCLSCFDAAQHRKIPKISVKNFSFKARCNANGKNQKSRFLNLFYRKRLYDVVMNMQPESKQVFRGIKMHSDGSKEVKWLQRVAQQSPDDRPNVPKTLTERLKRINYGY